MISPEELITLHSDTGVKTYTRAELEALADAGVLPSSLGAEKVNEDKPEHIPMDDDIFDLIGQPLILN